MPTKTITLEMDAYEKLRMAKRVGESFTEVIRRAVIPESAPNGKTLREHYQRGGAGVSDEYLDSMEQATAHDPIPRSPPVPKPRLPEFPPCDGANNFRSLRTGNVSLLDKIYGPNRDG